MYHIIKSLHSFIASIALLILILVISYAFYNWKKARPFTGRSKWIVMAGLMVTHLQVLIGLILYFVSPLGKSNLSAATMKVSAFRLYTVEHPLVMLLAAVTVTVGYSQSKRATDDPIKFVKIGVFYLVGLILILSRIPWQSWNHL